MEIVHSKLPYFDVMSILMKGDVDFNPSLTSSLDIEQYAMKLSQYADFILLQDETETLGCIAYYKNEQERFIYISHFWVSGILQGKGYGKLLLGKLCDMVVGTFCEIRLEVLKTNPALFFYQKQGFLSVEDRGSKFLMCLLISK